MSASPSNQADDGKPADGSAQATPLGGAPAVSPIRSPATTSPQPPSTARPSKPTHGSPLGRSPRVSAAGSDRGLGDTMTSVVSKSPELGFSGHIQPHTYKYVLGGVSLSPVFFLGTRAGGTLPRLLCPPCKHTLASANQACVAHRTTHCRCTLCACARVRDL